MASPKCQYALNEIIYYGCRDWQDKGILRKTISFFLQLLFVTLAVLFYIPVRLARRGCCCCKFKDWCCWKFRMFFEHPYSKFINHTMSYVVFLCLIFASSFEDKFGPGWAGLSRIGKFRCFYFPMNQLILLISEKLSYYLGQQVTDETIG